MQTTRFCRLRLFVLVLSIAVTGVAPLSSAEESPPPTAEQADAHFQAERWKQAAKAYAALTGADASNGRAWMRLGLARQQLADHKGSFTALLEAEKLGFAPPFARYNLALAAARLDRMEEAFDWLGKALDAGFTNAAGLEGEPDLGKLRGDDRFAGIVERARRNATPCKYDVRYREFDFWVGDWEVHDAAAQPVGANSIEETVNGCMLLENWTSATGGTGKSINFFDPLSEKWKQIWVDGSGGSITLEGALAGGVMRLEGRHVYRDGRVELIRGEWTPLPDGRVRQRFEQSRDDGKVWYQWFDGYYSKSSASSP